MSINRLFKPIYDELPCKTKEKEYVASYISTDLAISKNDAAAYTAVLVIHQYGHKPEDRSYYIDKRFINKRMSHLETLDVIASIHGDLNENSRNVEPVLVEEVNYQKAVIEQLDDRRIEAIGIKIYSDKRSRLKLVSHLFEEGKVYFHKDRSSDEIIQQLVNFGVEKHDDLADAMSMGLNYIQTRPKETPVRFRPIF